MLSKVLQRNAKPRKGGDFRHSNDGLYAAKHEARLSKHRSFISGVLLGKKSEIESLGLAPRFSGLRCRFVLLTMVLDRFEMEPARPRAGRKRREGAPAP
jgi:hypothetical protein